MLKRKWFVFALIAAFGVATALTAHAKVSPEESNKLKTELTPLGAERPGNADGTIPAWDGGIKGPPPGSTYKGPGHRHPDPFAEDKVLFSITAENSDKYAEKLSEGQLAMLKQYPGYRLDVYPTRRSQAAPQWVYDNTMKNALNAELTDGGVTHAVGGIPFPIPGRAEEVVWNHHLRWQGESANYKYKSLLIQPNGTITEVGGGVMDESYPFYANKGHPENYSGGYMSLFLAYDTPSRRKGEVLLVRDSINFEKEPRQAWQYLTGQRRVRRAPTVAYDTPNATYSGLATYDDAYIFNGSLDRYNWKLLGKKEVYIPYNCSMVDKTYENYSDFYKPNYINPDVMRWELHRVWVVEANLAEGKRHAYEKRVFYIDEDSWSIILADSYDSSLKLWRTNMALTMNDYELPGVVQREQVHIELTSGRYAVNVAQGKEEKIMDHSLPKPDSYFTPDEIRRSGRR